MPSDVCRTAHGVISSGTSTSPFVQLEAMQCEDDSPQKAAANKKRPHRKQKESSGRGGPGNIKVSSSPVGNAGQFLFVRVQANQCVADTPYYIVSGSPEEAYFSSLLSDVLKQLEVAGAPEHPFFKALSVAFGASKDVANMLTLHTIYLGQIRIVKDPDISSRTPPANTSDYIPDCYESYQVEIPKKDGTKMRAMVQAPVR